MPDKEQIQRATIEATVIRADGTIEHLGVLDVEWHEEEEQWRQSSLTPDK